MPVRFSVFFFRDKSLADFLVFNKQTKMLFFCRNLPDGLAVGFFVVVDETYYVAKFLVFLCGERSSMTRSRFRCPPPGTTYKGLVMQC